MSMHSQGATHVKVLVYRHCADARAHEYAVHVTLIGTAQAGIKTPCPRALVLLSRSTVLPAVLGPSQPQLRTSQKFNSVQIGVRSIVHESCTKRSLRPGNAANRGPALFPSLPRLPLSGREEGWLSYCQQVLSSKMCGSAIASKCFHVENLCQSAPPSVASIWQLHPTCIMNMADLSLCCSRHA